MNGGEEMKRLFAYGDIHGMLGFREFVERCKRSNLTADDYVVILGDFGLVWLGQGIEVSFLDELDKVEWTTLWIDGNHENFDLLKKYHHYYWNGSKVQFIRPRVIHLCRGQVYEIAGKKIFTFGGAQSYDRGQRVYGKSIWEDEIPS